MEAYETRRVERDLGLCRNSLVLLALVLGCDYWPCGVPKVGPISAGKLLASADVSEVLHRLASTDDGDDAAVEEKRTTKAAKGSVWAGPTWRKIKAGLANCPVPEVTPPPPSSGCSLLKLSLAKVSTETVAFK